MSNLNPPIIFAFKLPLAEPRASADAGHIRNTNVSYLYYAIIMQMPHETKIMSVAQAGHLKRELEDASLPVSEKSWC
jgi:hypothetical protein